MIEYIFLPRNGQPDPDSSTSFGKISTWQDKCSIQPVITGDTTEAQRRHIVWSQNWNFKLWFSYSVVAVHSSCYAGTKIQLKYVFHIMPS